MMSVSRDVPHVCSTFYLVRNEVFEIRRSAEILVKSFPVDLLVDRKVHEDRHVIFVVISLVLGALFGPWWALNK